MLNITKNSIHHLIQLKDFKANALLNNKHSNRLFITLISVILVAFFLFLFLPWTQNINAKGYITSRLPEQRPQTIQSIIGGRIEKWYVKEGDFVNVGDTIAFLSEIKNEYLDPELIERTAEQFNAKNQSIAAYDSKVNALEDQYAALLSGLALKKDQNANKIIQAKNKIAMDSVDLIAIKSNYEIALNQLNRTKELYNAGLKSLSDFQEKELKVQDTKAKVSVQENKILIQKNELSNLIIEQFSILRDYEDKLAKSNADKQTAISSKLESFSEASKLKNQLSNYTTRNNMYYILAPQSGFITKTLKKGIGETIKETAEIASIVPDNYDLAVELYVKPQELPLLNIGNDVRLRFDGWPAIVISGWPAASSGVFSGKIVAIDRFSSENGLYRIIVSPDSKDRMWPTDLRLGVGAKAFILLNDVPIWYEIWRQLNGFPSDFYKPKNTEDNSSDKKAPIKQIK